MSSTREWLLERLARVLRDVAPGAQFPTPFIGTGLHRPIVSTLKKAESRFFDPEAEGGVDSMPYACVMPAPGRDDISTVIDGELYEVSSPILIVAYAAQRGEDDSSTPDARATLDELRSDLLIAIEGFPFWKGAGAGEEVSAIERAGHVATILETSAIATPIYQPYGELTISYRLVWIESVAEG